MIPVTSQNNWRDRPGVNVSRRPRGKNLLPKEVQAIREAEARGEIAGGGVEREGPSMAYGITYAQPSGDNGDKEMKDVDTEPVAAPAAATEEQKPRTEDDIALQALIRESNGEVQGRSDLVIESKRDDEDSGARYDETTSFRADVQARPESATLDQYNAIPVEEFGAALLRGMGWKDGQAIGRGNYGSTTNATRPRIPERRPGFLGIGAKDVSGGKGAEMELGAWGKSAMRKGARSAEKEGGGGTEGVYMPVLMKNKQTGEYITEEELNALRKESKSRKPDKDDEWRERRDRNLEKSGRDRDRERDRDRDYKRCDYDDDDSDRYERRRNGSSRRDRDRSSSGDRYSRRDRKDKDDRYYRDRERDDYERHRDRDRDRDSTRDRERRRDRDEDRERRHRYRDDDRYSSRHCSSHTSRHGRDRDRDRDRDSDHDSHKRRRDDR